MDPIFLLALTAVALAYAWLPIRDVVCRRRGHRLCCETLRHSYEDGTYETEQHCMCRKNLVVRTTRVFKEREGPTWGDRASGATPATSP